MINHGVWDMKDKQLIFLALSVKALIISLGISLFYIQSIFCVAQWFDPIASDTSIRRAIERSNAPINEYSTSGYTGLMNAAMKGMYDIVELFLRRGAKVNFKSKTDSVQQGDTALLLAINNSNYSGTAKLVGLLLDNDAKPDIANAKGKSAMHKVLDITDKKLRLEVAKLLLDYGADINAQTNQGNTMMHLAAERRDKIWIRTMRDNYNSILDLGIKNEEGLTPAQLAKKRGYSGQDSVLSALTKPDRVLGQGYGKFNEKNSLGQNGLMAALMRNDDAFVDRMISKKIDINDEDNEGKTALFYAVESERPLYYVKKMIANDADVHERDDRGKTALFSVPNIKNIKERILVAKELIDNGASLDARDDDGNTIWHEAVEQGDYGLIKFLKKQAPLAKNTEGKTALEVARQRLKDKKLTPEQREKAKKIIDALTEK